MAQLSDVTGVLLIGGAARRFGGNKAFALYEGKPLYEYSYRALKAVSERLVVVGKEEVTHRMTISQSTIIKEDFPLFSGLGPLAGLYTAMKEWETAWYAVLPCDVPLIKEEVFHTLFYYTNRMENNKQAADAIVPISGEKKQPLIALYHRRSLPVIETLLRQEQLKMSFLLERINTHYVSGDITENLSEMFININTQAQYLKLKSKNSIE